MRSATQCAVWLEDQGGIGATEYVGFRRDGFSASNGSSPLSVSQNRTVRTRPHVARLQRFVAALYLHIAAGFASVSDSVRVK